MARLPRAGFLSLVVKLHLPTCKPCLAGKDTEKPFNKAKRAYSMLEIIHSNIDRSMNFIGLHVAY